MNIGFGERGENNVLRAPTKCPHDIRLKTGYRYANDAIITFE